LGLFGQYNTMHIQNADYIKNFDDSIIKDVFYHHNGNAFPKASVVIVTYNNKEPLLDTLNALKNQTIPNFEVVVIDNNDKLLVTEFIIKHNVTYIKLKENYGLSVGRNAGIKFAKGEIVIFLDDDAIPANNFVEEHITAHERYDIFGLRGKSLPKTKSIYNHLTSHYDLGEQVIPHHINLEGNSSFKKDFLLKIGGFNPKLQGAGGYEGVEITMRAMLQYKDKTKFIYIPNAIIYHDFSTTFAKYIKKRLRHAQHKKILESEFPDILLFCKEYSPAASIKKNSLTLFEQIALKAIKLLAKIICMRYGGDEHD
jgi:GT2 family glycosyltransferase